MLPESEQLSELTFDAKAFTADQAIGAFDRHGSLWLQNLLAPDFVVALANRFTEKYESLGQHCLGEKHAAVGDQRYMVTVRMKNEFNSPAMYANPIVMELLASLLGKNFLISSLGVVIAFPGAKTQPVHCDYPPLFEDSSACADLPPHAATLVVPLIDIDESTGGTAMWLGSHRAPDAKALLQRLQTDHRKDSFPGSVSLQTKLGDAFLMDYRLIHAGLANHSGRARAILYIVYSRPWFREDLNFSEQPAIKISRSQWKRVPKDLRHLFAAASLKK